MSASSRRPHVVGRRGRRAPTSGPARRASASVEVVGGAHRGVLAGQPGAEQQRVVGAERDRGAGLEQRRQRHRGQVGVDAERDVGDRAHLERRRPASTTRSSSVGVLGRPGRRGRAGRRAARRGRSGRSRARAARRRAGPSSSPARSAIAEGRREVRGAAAPLVVGEPEADHAAAGVLRGEPGQGARVERVPGAVGGDHHGDAEPGRRATRRATASRTRSVNAVIPPNRAAYPLGSTWISSQRPPSRDVVLGGLAHQPAYVVLGPQHRPGDVVEPLEAEPALLVGRRQLRRPVARPARRAARCRRARPARAGWRAASTR